MGDELAASRAAAPICFGQFDKFKPIDQSQQSAGLFPDLLRPAQVTGIVIGDACLDTPFGLFERDFRQEFAHIPDFLAEGRSPVSPFGVILEISAIFLERGSAGGAIGDDHIHFGLFKYGNIMFCLRPHQVETSITMRRHSAAFDIPGCDDRAAIAAQYPHRGCALLSKEQALGAAEEKTDPVFGLSTRWCDFRQRLAQGRCGRCGSMASMSRIWLGRRRVKPRA